ncbi:NlpC/P60 family protein [Paenibacillus filicis]|uniref:NlpC/P60 family protein n=1 Tax=Paenibacillus gyeongsangnamensis TaxID=3388067 RepID=A0ABT4Q9A9_9BACL|nr:C40 family peptidase [Paenibacillus filicis]MCZ8513461.1 NlpC/P60 family protein [Paenibacillus filicis]
MRRARISLAAMLAVVCMLTACGPQMSKEQQESGQVGKIPSTNGKSADRQMSELENGKRDPGMLPQDRQTNPSSGWVQPQSAVVREQLTIPLLTLNGKDYVIGTEFANASGYQYSWDAARSVFQMGENDPSYELTIGQKTALKDADRIKLADPPILNNSQLMIPAAALPLLFNDDLSYEVKGKSIIFRLLDQAVIQQAESPDEAESGTHLDFADDPADPAKSKMTSAAWPDQPAITSWMEEPALPAARGKSLDTQALTDRAQRYLGVPYEFGAASFAKSGKFDCSSFTKYVFDRYGWKLERTARAQAAQGTAVDRKSLRKGDLMFFYVPGKYRSNQIVGHVAIYMGDQKIIHAAPSPQNGVQITEINTAYWKRTFLRAVRLS